MIKTLIGVKACPTIKKHTYSACAYAPSGTSSQRLVSVKIDSLIKVS